MDTLLDNEGWDVITTAVDAALYTVIDAELYVWMQKRDQETGRGLLSLPGRFIPIHLSPEETVKEEIESLGGQPGNVSYFEQLGIAGAPNRDPRKRIMSVTYFGIVSFSPDSKPVDYETLNPGESGWVSVNSLEEGIVFSDHLEIIKSGRERISAKMEYSLISINFLEDYNSFTLKDIHAVYSAVWDVELDVPNFRRKLSKSAYIIKGDTSQYSSIAKIKKPSVSYKSIGDIATISRSPVLNPPIMR